VRLTPNSLMADRGSSRPRRRMPKQWLACKTVVRDEHNERERALACLGSVEEQTAVVAGLSKALGLLLAIDAEDVADPDGALGSLGRRLAQLAAGSRV
jgi:hypothetical protein